MFFGKDPRGGGRSFLIQKITLQILLVSKRYILVVIFGKMSKKGGRGGGVHRQSKKFIANLRILKNFLEKSNVISKKTSIFGETDVPKTPQGI